MIWPTINHEIPYEYNSIVYIDENYSYMILEYDSHMYYVPYLIHSSRCPCEHHLD